MWIGSFSWGSGSEIFVGVFWVFGFRFGEGRGRVVFFCVLIYSIVVFFELFRDFEIFLLEVKREIGVECWFSLYF